MDIVKDLMDIKNMGLAIYDTDVLDEQTVNDTRESIMALLEVESPNLELIIRKNEQEAEMLKALGNFYIEKSKTRENRNKLVKKLIKENMEILGVKKIETPTGSFTIKKNKPSLKIDDEKLIPAEFKEIEYIEKIKKEEIKKAIKNGKKIEGVHLEISESLFVK